MNRKKAITLTASVALLGAIGIGSTLAYFTDTETETNVITMGHVDISLEEPKFAEANADNTIENVTPNQAIEKDPTITVAEGSLDCYIRAKLEIEGIDDEAVIAELMDGINIDEAEWVLGDEGYYYCQTVKSAGDATALFTEVVIPSSWGNKMAEQTFKINVTAEAIQADNFTPEYSEAGELNGWNGVNAENYEDR